MLVIVKEDFMKDTKRKFMKSIGISALATAVLSVIPFKKSLNEVKINTIDKNETISIHPSAVKRNK
jgi:hypothetical protein